MKSAVTCFNQKVAELQLNHITSPQKAREYLYGSLNIR